MIVAFLSLVLLRWRTFVSGLATENAARDIVANSSTYTHIRGYMRKEYFKYNISSKKFVQATVEVIGVCYPSQNVTPEYRKLNSVTENDVTEEVTFLYSNYNNPTCFEPPVNSFVRVESQSSTVRTTNNVTLNTGLIHTGSLTVALRIYPGNQKGVLIRYERLQYYINSYIYL